MKTKVLESEKVENSVHNNPKVEEHDTFEEDWKNGISGEEVVKRVHEHLRKLYASQKKQ